MNRVSEFKKEFTSEQHLYNDDELFDYFNELADQYGLNEQEYDKLYEWVKGGCYDS